MISGFTVYLIIQNKKSLNSSLILQLLLLLFSNPNPILQKSEMLIPQSFLLYCILNKIYVLLANQKKSHP